MPTRLTLLTSTLIALLLLSLSPDGTPARAAGETTPLTADWRIAPQATVSETGAQLSLPGYRPAGWIPAQVPGTVFGSYVQAGLEKEPTYADNVYKVDRAKYDRNFWYRTEFTAPITYRTGRVWLNFDGVNRDADVYLNGQHVGALHGFFQRGRFDVTGIVHPGGRNVLAVLDSVPDQPPGKGENYSSPALICSVGWDWMPRVPGLNMGIYKDVSLTHTGPVCLVDPWVRTDLPTLAQADLSVQVGVENHSGSPVTGILAGVISPGGAAFSQPVRLGAGETRTVTLDSRTVAALRLSHPRLWWPNGYGQPNLYTLRLRFVQEGEVPPAPNSGGVRGERARERTAGAKTGPFPAPPELGAGGDSDQKTVTFGVKKYTYDTDNKTLHLHVNGVRVFPKGGSWGMAEFMLRCGPKDYDIKVRFHREMHFNMIRNWMGMTPDDAFYRACDKYGIMVWDEFWLNSSTTFGVLPADIPLFNANAVEKIKTFRNHPCIALWCAENEATPPPVINDALRAAVHTYDGDDRYYQENSHGVNLSGSGPWNDLDPKHYFTGVPTGGGEYQPFGLRSEIGTATMTSFDSFQKFMPKADWWPYDTMWDRHFLGKSAGNAGPGGYQSDLARRYGAAHGIQEYCAKAQFLNLETMKAIYEGWLDHSDTDASGVLIWMSQSAYPSFVWQTYDYYYDTTGAYWGAKTACEPVHVYWNQSDDRIRVVNTSGKDDPNLTAEAWIYNLDGTPQYHRSAALDSRPDKVADCFTLLYPDTLSPTHFIKLRLKNRAGQVVSENFYWRGTTRLNYTALNGLKPVKLQVRDWIESPGSPPSPQFWGDRRGGRSKQRPYGSGLLSHSGSPRIGGGGGETLTATITNPANSHVVAFAIRPKLVNPKTGQQILPVFMSDGYFSLIPGETKRLTIQFDPADAGHAPPRLVVECWNNSVKSAPAARVKTDNLALFQPATSSSDDDYSGGPSAAVDGDPLTRWASAWSADPQWLQVDLGKSQPIRRVKITWEAAYARSYQIQVSDDGVHWTDVYQTTAGKGGTEDLTGLSGQGRYVRLYCTERATTYGDSLYEFEVYGPAAGAAK